MILVDTSIWIDHLSSPNTAVNRYLRAGEVVMHSMGLESGGGYGSMDIRCYVDNTVH